MPRSSARAHQGIRALVATSGLALIATSVSLVAAPAQAADPVSIQIIGTNDFHGRLLSGTGIPGAAKYAGALNAFRADNPNTIFAAAGDLIGATTFESFIAEDKPTIDVFNEMDLDVSAVGNHEFDQGYADLVNRVMQPASATNPNGGAAWEYIGANIDEPGDADEIAPSWTVDVAGVKVGFVGAVTEHLHELVNQDGIAGLEVTDIVAAANTEAAALRAGGADVVVLLVHEGAPSTDCATMDDDPTSDFGSVINNVSGDVDAIVSGHTHLNYSCSFPVASWAGRPVTQRPVVSAGQYGEFLNRLTFSVDPDTGSVLASSNVNVNVNTGTFTADPEVQAIVQQAQANADAEGAVELGKIAAPFKRASRPKADGTGFEENRGAESTLGNLVAEAQRWAADSQIGFMNPGGLRADMVGNAAAGYPAPVTYRQAANVQPFANTLVNVDLTGAEIETVLEQQWQPAGASRPFLRLGTSAGFTYTYDPAAREVTGMFLFGEPLKDDQTYTVTANSFLASGGDNFPGFKEGPQRDTGQTDLQAMVDYMDEFASAQPLTVDPSQHAVGVSWPAAPLASYGKGDTLAFNLSSLAMTGAGDAQDDEVIVSVGSKDIGTFPVDNTVAPGATDDEAGKASVSVTLPGGLPGGPQYVTVLGPDTSTMVFIPLTFDKTAASIKAHASPDKVVVDKTKPVIHVTVKTNGQNATGKVELKVGGETYTAKLKNGKADVKLPPFNKAGEKQVKISYLGNESTKSASASVTITVKKK